MSSTRTCEHCHGERFLMTTESGVVIVWRNVAGNHDTWFCPRCDWTSPPRHDRET